MTVYSLVMDSAEAGIFVLVLFDLLFCADVLFKNAWQDAGKGRITLSVLVGTSALAAFCYGLSKTFFVHPLAGPVQEIYIPLTVLLSLYLWRCGRVTRSKERTGVFIKKLDDFLPKSGRLVQGEREMKVFARELEPGDLIRVKPGERIPCEGRLEEGSTEIDENLITGNRLPAVKTRGAHVYAGTLNKGGEIRVRVEKKLAESVMAGIIGAIKNSERRRCQHQDPLDGYAWWVLAVAGLLGLVGYLYVYRAGGYLRPLHSAGIVLFMVGLGCPLSFLFSTGFASYFVRAGAKRRKIDVQTLQALEEFFRADTVFFDKTGTLTCGELQVDSVYARDGEIRKELLSCLASAEQQVDGPVAQAINWYVQQKGVRPQELTSFDVFPGKGVRAVCGPHTYLAGLPQWLLEQGVQVPIKKMLGEQTVVCAAKNGNYLGYVLLDDRLRLGAKKMIRLLRALGKEVILMSGDNEASVLAVARQVGIEKVNFGVLPQTKAEILGNYAALGRKTVMVGDGFNDIVALLRADAGIVFSSGKNVYNNWVDIIIRRRDLGSVTDLLKIYTRLHSCIRGNVILSLACNTLLLAGILWAPLSAAQTGRVLLGGLAAGIAALLFNSMRLLHIK